MDKDTQLPAEVVTKIHANADSYMKSCEDEGTEWGAYVNGATEYAIELAQVKQYNAELRIANTKMRNLLENFISWHESGLLPNQNLYISIKTFLDGEK